MDASGVRVSGQVWLVDEEVLITDYRDYARLLPVVKRMSLQARVRAVSEDEIPEDAERVV